MLAALYDTSMDTAHCEYDLCVIGGGINGAGIARDAAGRGLSVLLVEKGDLAAATSSASTKLIHGGLRYLEHYEFRLVRESLKERETLLAMAPHIIWPLSFILPHDKTLRPAWLIRAGLFLYDHIGGRKTLPASRGVSLAGGPLQARYKKGFRYADCWVEDARLVVLNAMDAAKRGAVIRTRTACTGLKPANGGWQVELNGKEIATARIAVNAAGPWVRALLDQTGLARSKTPQVRLVKGSHIIVPHLYNGAHAYILQQPDKRIVFTIPYEQDFTLIGTTDTEISGDPGAAALDAQETDYLCAAVNRSFAAQITPDDIVTSYSGVRALLDDGDENASRVTRDYRLELDEHEGGAKLLSVFGGKLTTYRRLAEEAVDMLSHKPRWTAGATLPGGDFDDFETFVTARQARYPALPAELVRRYARAYGTLMDHFAQDPGRHFGDDLYEAEIAYLIEHEWARTAEDILWRRSKRGLHVAPETVHNLEAYMKEQHDRR